MVLSDITFTQDGIKVIGGLLMALAGVIVYLYKSLEKRYEERSKADEETINSWKQIGGEALKHLRTEANKKRRDKGQDLLPELAAVISEHASLPTPKQRTTAEIATARASLVDATKDLGLEPREETKGVEIVESSGPVSFHELKPNETVIVKQSEEKKPEPPPEGRAL